MFTLNIRFKFFLSHFIAILLVSGVIGVYFYFSALDNLTSSLQSRLKYSAAILSQSFESETLDKIDNGADADTERFQNLLSKVRAFATSNPDIAFVYLMRKKNSRVEFLVDSDPDDPANPGDIYEEYIPELIQGFSKLSVDSTITSDRWGSFMSGYAPIKNGDHPYLVGIDMRADEVHTKLERLKTQALFSLIGAVIFAYFCAYLLSKNMIARIQLLHNKCINISPSPDQQAAPQKGDELDDLSNTFDVILESMQKEHSEVALQAQNQIEKLIDENNQLREQIDQHERMQIIMQKTATTDFLTGVANRRKVTGLLDSAINAHTIYSIALIDIDYFKEINDKHGHDFGDKVLRHFARFILHNIPQNFTLGRWGGEEFILFMPETSSASAFKEVEKIRYLINQENFSFGNHTIILSASIGVAERKENEAWEGVIKRTDFALYDAKNSGRNKSRVFQESKGTT